MNAIASSKTFISALTDKIKNDLAEKENEPSIDDAEELAISLAEYVEMKEVAFESFRSMLVRILDMAQSIAVGNAELHEDPSENEAEENDEGFGKRVIFGTQLPIR